MRNRPTIALAVALGVSLAPQAKAQTPAPNPGLKSDSLGGAFDAWGRMLGIEPPTACAPELKKNGTCPKGFTPDQLKALGLFGLFDYGFGQQFRTQGCGEYPVRTPLGTFLRKIPCNRRGQGGAPFE